MISHSIKATTTFNLGQMAGDHNAYDNKLPHPMSSEIEFISNDGTKVKAYVGQIAIMVAIANEYPSMGKAIDAMFTGIDKDKVSEICRKF